MSKKYHYNFPPEFYYHGVQGLYYAAEHVIEGLTSLQEEYRENRSVIGSFVLHPIQALRSCADVHYSIRQLHDGAVRRQALEFTNRLADLAEEVNHHPDLRLGWGYVHVSLWTHKIDGLSEADFVWAAKADRL